MVRFDNLKKRFPCAPMEAWQFTKLFKPSCVFYEQGILCVLLAPHLEGEVGNIPAIKEN